MRYTLILLLILFSVPPLFSQSQIIGTWDVNWSSTKSAMNSSENEKYVAMPSTTQEKVKSTFNSRTYTFFSDGRIDISWKSEDKDRKVNGTWTLNGTTLTIAADGKENQYTVNFSGATLTLSKKGERNLFSVIVLTKRA